MNGAIFGDPLPVMKASNAELSLLLGANAKCFYAFYLILINNFMRKC